MAYRGDALPHVRRQVLIGRWRGASAGVDRRAQLAAVTIRAIVTAWRGLAACSWSCAPSAVALPWSAVPRRPAARRSEAEAWRAGMDVDAVPR